MQAACMCKEAQRDDDVTDAATQAEAAPDRAAHASPGEAVAGDTPAAADEAHTGTGPKSAAPGPGPGHARWHSTRSRLRGLAAVSQWLKGDDGATAAALRDDGSPAEAVPPNHVDADASTAVEMGGVRAPRTRCYAIPEEEDGVPQGGASGVAAKAADSTNARRWRCPLSAPKTNLPSNAKLEGNLLEIGAAPNMRGCRRAAAARAAVARVSSEDAAAAQPSAQVPALAAAQAAPSEVHAASGHDASDPGAPKPFAAVPAAAVAAPAVMPQAGPVAEGAPPPRRASEGAAAAFAALRVPRFSSPLAAAPTARGSLADGASATSSHFTSPTASLIRTRSSSIWSTTDLVPPRATPAPHPDVPRLDMGGIGGYQSPSKLRRVSSESIDWPTASTANAAASIGGGGAVSRVVTAVTASGEDFGTPQGRPRVTVTRSPASGSAAAGLAPEGGPVVSQKQGPRSVGLVNNDLMFATAASDASWA
jgi:hypothetical protein